MPIHVCLGPEPYVRLTMLVTSSYYPRAYTVRTVKTTRVKIQIENIFISRKCCDPAEVLYRYHHQLDPKGFFYSECFAYPITITDPCFYASCFLYILHVFLRIMKIKLKIFKRKQTKWEIEETRNKANEKHREKKKGIKRETQINSVSHYNYGEAYHLIGHTLLPLARHGACNEALLLSLYRSPPLSVPFRRIYITLACRSSPFFLVLCNHEPSEMVLTASVHASVLPSYPTHLIIVNAHAHWQQLLCASCRSFTNPGKFWHYCLNAPSGYTQWLFCLLWGCL